jgi:archaellum component FlaG (FlaF/FlaG flagellin family)
MKKLSLVSLFSIFQLLFSNTLFAQQGSLRFDGVDDKVIVPANAAFNSANSITCEAWINATQWKAQIYQGTIVGKDGSNTSGYALRCGANGKLSFVIGGPGGWTEATCGSVMQANVWTHVAGVFDNGSIKIYINGNLVGTNTATTITASTSGLLIGESPGFAGRVFNGYIDEVRVWNTARSQSDIAANITVDLPNNEPGLVAYYKFNQISGTTTPNEITSTLNSVGTLTNFPANPWSTGYMPPSTDLSTSAILSPDIITFYSGSARVKARFKNTGLDTLTAFAVGYALNNGLPVIENITTTLSPNQEYEHAFHKVISSVGNTSTLKVFSMLSADNNALNDTASYALARPSGGIYTLPIFTNSRHNFGAFGQTQSKRMPLPDNNTRFSQILLTIGLACPTSGCDPWDQPAKISLVKDGQTYELARFITPYGKACGPWTVDITSFKSLLQGNCDFESYIQVWGASGWLLNVSITFIETAYPLPYQKVTRLWETDNWVYGEPTLSHDLPLQTVAITPNTQEVEFRMTNTGHGQANTDNAAEFSQKTHTLQANGTTVANHVLWKANCAQNTCSNQSGTWTFNRAGWCPGQAVDPFFHDLSTVFTAGQNLTIDYTLQPYINLLNTGYNGGSHTEPHYKIHAFVVEKSNTFIDGDSLINSTALRISFPLTNANLSATTPVKVWVKNTGTTALSGLHFYCFANDSLQFFETPVLALAAGDSVEYTFSNTLNLISGNMYNIAVLVDADNDEASSDDVASLIINNTVGLFENLSVKNRISVYPNPSNGHFVLQANLSSEPIELSFYDIQGKLVHSCFPSQEQLLNGLKITAPLLDGFYNIKLKTESGVFIEKLIVHH